MKVNIEIDCTPEEARQFMGLPDVSALQAEMLAGLREKVAVSARTMDPETLMKGWLAGAAPGMEGFQKMFWSNISRPPNSDKTSG